MTTPSNAELREAIEAIILSPNRFGEDSDKADRIIELFQDQQQQLMDEIYDEYCFGGKDEVQFGRWLREKTESKLKQLNRGQEGASL